MMKIKTKVVKNHLPNLMARLRAMDGKEVSVGYWNSMGLHENSKLTYANLMALMEFGSPSTNMPARPVLTNTFGIYEKPSKSVIIKNGLRHYFSNIQRKTPPINFSQVLRNIGSDYVFKVRVNFGDTSKLESNALYTQRLKEYAGVKGNNPLIFHGDLRDNLSYSIDGINITTPA